MRSAAARAFGMPPSDQVGSGAGGGLPAPEPRTRRVLGVGGVPGRVGSGSELLR